MFPVEDRTPLRTPKRLVHTSRSVEGPRKGVFLMSEVPLCCRVLEGAPNMCVTHRCPTAHRFVPPARISGMLVLGCQALLVCCLAGHLFLFLMPRLGPRPFANLNLIYVYLVIYDSGSVPRKAPSFGGGPPTDSVSNTVWCYLKAGGCFCAIEIESGSI